MEIFAIYVVYDPMNVIHNYVYELLLHLKKNVSRLVVVCNFSIKDLHILDFADEVVSRENIGFDALAYAEEILKRSSEIKRYNSLLLLNDTFYGPIDSFDRMFNEMASVECDYWGITKHPGGMLNSCVIPEHIQSYFLLFRKPIIQMESFYDYWRKLIAPATTYDAIMYFEIGINQYLTQLGFLGFSYMEYKGFGKMLKENDNPYIIYPLQLVKDYEIPIIKRRSFDIESKWFCESAKAVLYIKDNCKYDENLIINHLKFLSAIDISKYKYDYTSVCEFVNTHKNIYIYGNGTLAGNMDYLFKMLGLSSALHVVSDDVKKDNEVGFSEVDFSDGDGVIIAVSRKEIVSEIFKNCMSIFKNTDILKPQ